MKKTVMEISFINDCGQEILVNSSLEGIQVTIVEEDKSSHRIYLSENEVPDFIEALCYASKHQKDIK